MGAMDFTLRVPFASVNKLGDVHYREGWVRHHVHPIQCLRDAMLAPFLLAMRDEGFHIDDFETNGVLLPALPSQSILSGKPLHLGSHPNYNVQMIGELNAIRKFCESIRPDSKRRVVALRGLRGSQTRARAAILNQRGGHVDRVVLSGRTDGDLDRLIDRIFASNGV
jgi:A nuclease family of the HNH/ENDO VII superfamily with conserved AHH